MPPAFSLQKSTLDKLSQLTPWRPLGRIFVEMSACLAIAVLCEVYGSWLWLPLAFLLIARSQHALLVIMHDCAHHRVLNGRFANTLLGELISWPFLMTMRGYRRHHQKHHIETNLNTMNDPDFERTFRAGWRFPTTRSALLKVLLKDVLMLNTLELLQEARDAKNNQIATREDALWMVFRIAALIGLAAALTVWGGWHVFLLYWLLPLLTFLKAILRIRAIADHFNLPGPQSAEQTRTVLAPWWERFLLAPCNIGIHTPHHRYPSIPYYRLKLAHAELSKDRCYAQRVQVSSGYWQVLRECCTTGGAQ